MSATKANVLLVGGGGIGTMTAVNLVAGGKANVTMVLRSNYSVVEKNGFDIKSVDHGEIKNWRPHRVLPAVPNVSAENLEPYDYVVCVTKNTPDISPTVIDIIGPAITPAKTVVVLVQNGLNIEKAIIATFPQNIVLSGVSMMGSHELRHGVIEHNDKDILVLGPFRNPNVESAAEQAAGKDFADRYTAGGKTTCNYVEDAGFSRWRKLVYNACLNPICAILQLDSGRLRLAEVAYPLLRPAMNEIIAAAEACGHELPATVIKDMIELDPMDMYFSPSMCVDVSKGNFIEYEVILGEPLREGGKRGVPMPTIAMLYNMCKALQWRTKEGRGMVTVPPKGNYA